MKIRNNLVAMAVASAVAVGAVSAQAAMSDAKPTKLNKEQVRYIVLVHLLHLEFV